MTVPLFCLVAGSLFALWRAPRASLAIALAVGVLIQVGAIDARGLPLAAEIGDAADSVRSWQRDRIDAGACHVGSVQALAEGELQAPAGIEAACERSAGTGAATPR